MKRKTTKNKKEPLAVTHPEIAAQWHPTKNGNLTPYDVTHGSGKKVWWFCEVAPDHEWPALIKKRTKGESCHCCRGVKVVKSNCLATTHPKVAAQWHPTKNGNLTPYDVTCGSHKKVWWQCKVAPDHEWPAVIYSRTLDGNSCGCCRGFRVVMSNCLATTHPEIAAQWHPTKNGNLTPYDVTHGSGKKVWWFCEVAPDHEWPALICDRKKKNCACCRGVKIVKSNCLATTHPKIAAEWHPTKNGNLTPYDITCGSHKKVWWLCEQGHEWPTAIYNRALNNTDCSSCYIYKREEECRDIFENLLKYKFPKTRHKEIVHRRTGSKLEIDGYCKELNMAFEYQGEQHYKSIEAWGGEKNLKDIKERDRIKRNECKRLGIKLIEIPYWIDDLKDYIKKEILRYAK